MRIKRVAVLWCKAYNCSVIRAYEEMIDFIAAGNSSVAVAQFIPSQATMEHLIAREKTMGITLEENK